MRKNILKRLIDNLSGADLRRVRKDPMEIMGMEHPSEAAQLYVVRQNPEMIQFIGAPSEKVQLEVVRKIQRGPCSPWKTSARRYSLPWR